VELKLTEVKMRTLIVDDSSLMRKMVERALRLAGLNMDEVLQAGNGEEALQLLRAETTKGTVLNLIVSDINMPVMDGLQFLEQRQKENLAQGVPVIMITTEGNESFVRRAIAAGAMGYICKPFIPDQIKAKIQHLL
jgi:two-component system chemotaxis response regulator CheY